MSNTAGGGRRYGYSPTTDTWYVVTEWDDVGDGTGKMVAQEKEEILEKRVPPRWKGGLEWEIKDGDEDE